MTKRSCGACSTIYKVLQNEPQPPPIDLSALAVVGILAFVPAAIFIAQVLQAMVAEQR